jgi:hypothetical protein
MDMSVVTKLLCNVKDIVELWTKLAADLEHTPSQWTPRQISTTLTALLHLAYNPSYSVCFFSRNSIFLSQKISQQCFSVGL